MKHYAAAFRFAVGFLTRIPAGPVAEPDGNLARRSLALFPLVGWLIGVMLYGLCSLLMLTGRFSPFTAALILVAAETLLTGAFHLDGLADTHDGFYSTAQTPERRLAIMQDSRIGVMGAAALMLCLALKAALLGECIRSGLETCIVFYPAFGRLAQVALYASCPYVRPGGIGQLFARAASVNVFVGAAALVLPALAAHPQGAVAACALLGCFLAGYRRHALRRIGGITGDVLGSATVMAEIIVLAACLFSMPGP